MSQVTGNKIHTVQASKNLGTVINTQVSGENTTAIQESKARNKGVKTQLAGLNKMANYMGTNDEGMNIFETKKVDKTFYQKDQYTCQSDIIKKANEEIVKQEKAKKEKYKTAANEIDAFTADIVTGLKEGDPNVAAQAKVATLSAIGGTAPYVYTLRTDAVKGRDNAKFAVSTADLKVGSKALTEGTYLVALLATDAKGVTKELNIQIIVGASA